jgi:hypothetical protein
MVGLENAGQDESCPYNRGECYLCQNNNITYHVTTTRKTISQMICKNSISLEEAKKLGMWYWAANNRGRKDQGGFRAGAPSQ